MIDVVGAFNLFVCFLLPVFTLQIAIYLANAPEKLLSFLALVPVVFLAILWALAGGEYAAGRALLLLISLAVSGSVVFVMNRLGLHSRIGPPGG